VERHRKRNAEGKNGAKPPGNKYNTLLSQVKYSGILPTPMAQEGGKITGLENQDSLTKRVRNGLLPTPNKYDYNTSRSKETFEKAKEHWAEKGVNLQMPLKQMATNGLLPTPVKSDHQNRWPTENWKGDSDLPSVVNGTLGTRSRLNPPFVAEMMGFPPDWTLSPFLSGETKA
jgi:hypothetical protein